MNTAIALLQSVYLKEKGPAGHASGKDGFNLTRSAFAVMLQLQDQVESFEFLVDSQDLDSLEPKERHVLQSMWNCAS